MYNLKEILKEARVNVSSAEEQTIVEAAIKVNSVDSYGTEEKYNKKYNLAVQKHLDDGVEPLEAKAMGAKEVYDGKTFYNTDGEIEYKVKFNKSYKTDNDTLLITAKAYNGASGKKKTGGGNLFWIIG